jgi:hypothetical protein
VGVVLVVCAVDSIEVVGVGVVVGVCVVDSRKVVVEPSDFVVFGVVVCIYLVCSTYAVGVGVVVWVCVVESIAVLKTGDVVVLGGVVCIYVVGSRYVVGVGVAVVVRVVVWVETKDCDVVFIAIAVISFAVSSIHVVFPLLHLHVILSISGDVLFGHGTHDSLPTVVLIVPTAHAEHHPPSGPVYPA